MVGTFKLKQWRPQPKPNEEMCKRLRQYIVQAVFARWNKETKPSTLMSIFYRVQDRIREERKLGRWPREWKQPGKRTIDRRVNEAADPRFYENGIPKIVAVTAGVYQPNPKLFLGGKTDLHNINQLKPGLTGPPATSKLVEVGVTFLGSSRRQSLLPRMIRPHVIGPFTDYSRLPRILLTSSFRR